MKIKTSITAKIIAWILIAISGLGLVGSAALAVGMESAGFYGRTYAEIREAQFENYHNRYSARVLEYLGAEKNTNREYFADKNFRYGVIEADFLSQVKALDLNNEGIYLDTNFDFKEELEFDNLHLFQCTISEHTQFVSENPDALWGYYRIYNTQDIWNTHRFESLILDKTTGIFLTKTDNGYSVVPKVAFYIANKKGSIISQGYAFDEEKKVYKPVEVVQDISFGEEPYQYILEIHVHTDMTAEEIEKMFGIINGEKEAVVFSEAEGTLLNIDAWNFVRFCGKTNLSEAEWIESEINEKNYESVPDNASISDMGTVISMTSVPGKSLKVISDELDWSAISYNLQDEIYVAIEEGLVYMKSADRESHNYYVLSYRENEFISNTELPLLENDLFGTFDVVVRTLYSMRYQVFAILFGCLAVFLVAFAFLCSAAGHHKGQIGLAETAINRIPLEIYGGVTGAAEVFFVIIFAEAMGEIRTLGDIFWFIVMGMAVLLGGLLAVAAVLEIITRFKLHILWKNTICYWGISKVFGGCKQAAEFMMGHTSLAWKAILLVGCNAVMDFMIIAMSHGTAIWILLFILKSGLLLLAVLGVVSQLKRLKDGGEHMAKGNLAYRVNTEGMFWEFKHHGEHLNSVGEGLAIAVEDRMKSERFKTELITNVSHDIKTPLTSIINYVDLMQKEESANPKIEEYLEVLDRQSKRLKKLLEDLLEASKASAGTLQVEFETLEAGVFMVQTVGEFEEKTKALNLELIIKKPEEPIYIRADGRHFWRVIDNLMNNICKYAQPNTRVYINLEATKEEACITFRNTSAYPLNITSEELKERFVRGDESRHTEGSGLGLSIAQSLMELMNGRFELIVDGDLFKVILTFKRVCKAEL